MTNSAIWSASGTLASAALSRRLSRNSFVIKMPSVKIEPTEQPQRKYVNSNVSLTLLRKLNARAQVQIAPQRANHPSHMGRCKRRPELNEPKKTKLSALSGETQQLSSLRARAEQSRAALVQAMGAQAETKSGGAGVISACADRGRCGSAATVKWVVVGCRWFKAPSAPTTASW